MLMARSSSRRVRPISRWLRKAFARRDMVIVSLLGVVSFEFKGFELELILQRQGTAGLFPHLGLTRGAIDRTPFAESGRRLRMVVWGTSPLIEMRIEISSACS